jgi:hypothetical protein
MALFGRRALITGGGATFTPSVDTQAAMLALADRPGQRAFRTDLGSTFEQTASPASTLANWQQISDEAAAKAEAAAVGISATATNLGSLTPTTGAPGTTETAKSLGEKLEKAILDLVSLSGVARNAASLGTFAGVTIADNRDTKGALQDLETSLETVTFEPRLDGRLEYVSATQLRLARRNGRRVFINDANVVIPSTAPTLSNSGLSASTLYYVYAYVNAGTLTLEASATAYATDSTYGHQVKSGDSTRTLVGMVRTNASSQFVDSAGQRLVRSWAHDPGVATTALFTANRSTSSLTAVELNSEIRNEVLLWAGETWDLSFLGAGVNATASGWTISAVAIDGTTAENGGCLATTVDAVPVVASAYRDNLSEGYHYATVVGSVNAGTGTWYGNRCRLSGRTSRR